MTIDERLNSLIGFAEQIKVESYIANETPYLDLLIQDLNKFKQEFDGSLLLPKGVYLMQTDYSFDEDSNDVYLVTLLKAKTSGYIKGVSRVGFNEAIEDALSKIK